MLIFIFHRPDHPQLWDVWKQEQHHQFERGFFGGGGSITVRKSFCSGKSSQRLHVQSSDPASVSSVGSSLCTVSCTQTPRGVRLRLSSRATAPFSSSSPSCLGIWKAGGDPCLTSDCAAAVFSPQIRAVFSSLFGLLCGPIWDYYFLFRAWTCHRSDWIEGTSSGQEVAFSVKFCRQSVELCDVFVACKCICDSHRMYCHIFQLSSAFN